MTPEDAAQVATVHTLAWQHAYRGIIEQRFLDAIDIQKRTENWEKGIRANDPSIARLVAVSEGKVIAFACGLSNRTPLLTPLSDCELWAIYVHPLEFRRGAGKFLMAQFKSEMKREGKNRMCVWVLEANQTAQAFYKSQGGVLIPTKKETSIGNQSLMELVYEFAL